MAGRPVKLGKGQDRQPLKIGEVGGTLKELES